jgi:hypothetical protein
MLYSIVHSIHVAVPYEIICTMDDFIDSCILGKLSNEIGTAPLGAKIALDMVAGLRDEMT